MKVNLHGKIARLVATPAGGFKSEYLELDGARPTWTDKQAAACIFDTYDLACDRAVMLKAQDPAGHYFALTCGLTEEERARRSHRRERRIRTAIRSTKEMRADDLAAYEHEIANN